ncbi:MAG: hypothetical protein S4CHLAM20_08950 [Chlamydiia bacterium]|nr:hypothetical protein [Chlamydiia bacterium]
MKLESLSINPAQYRDKIPFANQKQEIDDAINNKELSKAYDLLEVTGF